MLVAYVHVATSDPATAEAARDYLRSVSDSADMFRLCLERLHTATLTQRHDHVKFVCLNMLQRGIEQRYQALGEEAKSFIRTQLLLYVRDVLPAHPVPKYVTARVATCLTAIAKSDYPGAWPSFFDDFISFLPQGAVPAELFVLTLTTLEEDIIKADTTMSTGQTRERMDAVIAMGIKDAMRAGPLPAIVGALETIILTYMGSHPALALSALSILAVYVEWIELDLVVNDKFFPLLFNLLSEPTLRNGAAAVLTAITTKGMPRYALTNHLYIYLIEHFHFNFN